MSAGGSAHGHGLEARAHTAPAVPATRGAPGRPPFWSALATSALALAAFGVAATTPPRTGPFAVPGTALAYPFAAADRFVPGDFVWMYLVLVMLAAFLVLSVALHEAARDRAPIWGMVGLVLAVASFAILGLAYFVQIYTVQPALVAHEAADVVALSQYNPHGLFIAAENLGYLLLALSLGAFAPTMGGTRLNRAARWVFAGAAALGTASLVAMSFVYGIGLEYRFEVAIISVVYLALFVGGALIAGASRGRAATTSPAAADLTAA